MNKIILTIVVMLSAFLSCSFQKDGGKEPWTEKQLMSPAVLAEKISKGEPTTILNIGPSGKIKNSIYIGPTQDVASMDLLKKKLEKLPRNAEVVVYCGCCPFKNCPNIRPAVELLNDMKFTNRYLLNIPKNLKKDWIDKGYPMQNKM